MQHPTFRFVAVLLGVYVAWYVAYDLVILPDGRVDAWLSEWVAGAAGWSLHAIGLDVQWQGRVVRYAGANGVLVANGCNGLATLGLFVGFVLAFPGLWMRRAIFIPAGLVLLTLANVFRVATLAVMQVLAPSLFVAMHGFALTAFFYCIVLGLWIAWAHLGSRRHPESGEPSETTQSLAPA